MIFEYLGAIYFWTYLSIIYSIGDKKAPVFSDILHGKSRTNGSLVDGAAYSMKLKTIGLFVTMGICYLIVKSGI
ncbi:MAG: hypothetical protein AAGC88_04570 [Bacteroidota bacterium]